MSLDQTSAPKGHPKGLYFLFFTEMWERFSYYGMRAIFMLFMVKVLLMNDKEASQIYGSYTGLVYLTPLLGGYLCDRFLGNRRSIIVGGFMMAIGQFFMFLSASKGGPEGVPMMWAGLTALIIGNGFFKPNISTMVGQLYPANDRRIDSAFTIFYMGINLGAFFSPLVCSSFNEYKWGFLAACIGMLIGVVTFVFFQKRYLISEEGKEIGNPVKPLDFKNWGYVIGSIAIIFFLLNFKQMASDGVVFGITISPEVDLISYLIYGSMIIMPLVILTDKKLTKAEIKRITVIFTLAFFVIFFWGAFEQAGASLTLFADRQTNRNLFGWDMPAEYFQSVNPLAVITLAPLFSVLWGFLYKRNAEPSSPTKMAWGLTLVAAGYAIIAFAVHGIGADEKVSMWWLFGLYVIHTMGELCLSPIGLSMVSKLAPLRLSSLLMGTWFLANAAANKFAGTLSALIPPSEPTPNQVYPQFLGFQISNLFEFFVLFIVMTGAAAAILFVLSRTLQKMINTPETAA
jgi:POT family proton-dependent oligopeptide transporter